MLKRTEAAHYIYFHNEDIKNKCTNQGSSKCNNTIEDSVLVKFISTNCTGYCEQHSKNLSAYPIPSPVL